MSSIGWLAAILIAILAAATSLRFTPDPKKARLRLRRSVILFFPYAALTLLMSYGAGLIPASWQEAIQIAHDFSIVLLIVNLSALWLFDVLLPLVRWSPPDILHDLTVGASYLVALVWLMHRTGVNVASIVATSAVATAVIGLSLQSTLGNVIGGLALQIDDSLHEGDWVELENKIQGRVLKVRWRHTLIETRDWDTLVVPNSQLLSQTIRLLGRREGQPRQRRYTLFFQVDFRTAPADVISVVDKALRAAPIVGVAAAPEPNTVCMDLARDGKDSFAVYGTRYWLKDLTRDDPTNSLVRERIYAALKRAQIPLAMPAAALFVSTEDASRLERKQKQLRSKVRAGLKSVDLFRGLTDEELEELAEAVKVAPFAAGEVVTRQGAQANWLYVLIQGQVEILIATATGGSNRVNTLTAPDFFGEMAVVAGTPREATVVAIDEVECLRVERNTFRVLLERRPEIARDVAQTLAERRVALQAAREHLDAEARSQRMEGERHRILSAVQQFLGLKE
ncbi:MAG TPA: mechanosensitive ion channel family protein [Polyangiaceae bacterium]|jgi:small-conductance mechanosensitive channel/CRP-like cAMP-binding protein|nr:mechanosensitive ion channel family protein [Polyangiaceae bacterium]